MTTIAFAGAAHIHTPGFIRMIKERSDVRVKLVYDHDAARAQARATELGAVAISDPKLIWQDPEIQAVVVCAETNLHEPLVLAGAAAGKHLFVEKPLGMGAADSFRMAAAIETAGVLFQTGYFRRGDAIHQFIREQVQAGAFGKITRVRHSNCHSGSLKGWFDTDWRWMADPKQAGCGAFGDLGTHVLDILLWLFGPVAAVTASVGVATARYGDCDEFGEGLLRFQSGAVGTLAAGWVDHANPVGLLVSGTEGHAVVVNNQLFVVSSKIPGADGKTPWTQLPAPWPHAFMLWLDAVGGKTGVPLVGVREAAYVCAVTEALYAGAKQGTWVPLAAPLTGPR
jgi:predicted dehydrogenase